MKKAKRLLLWLWMLSKRLYKKPTFLALLILIPVLVLGYTAVSGGDSGMITVGLTCRGDDPMAQEIFADLQNGTQLVEFQVVDTPQGAEELLRAGKLDAVWIFPEQIAEKVEAFAQKPISSNAFITVLEREDNVTLMIAREKLNGAVYPYVAQRVYVHFLRDLAPELNHLSDQELMDYYYATDLSSDLFEFQGAAAKQEESNYLLSPVRGLLGVLILLCALATGMYYTRDAENGTFAWVNRRWLFLPELGCHLTATLHTGAVCLICLGVTGLAGNLWTELLTLVLYSLCCGVFAMALRQVLPSLKLQGAILPLIIVAALLVSPVFFDLGSLRQLQYFLPPTYYINAIYHSDTLVYMAIYTLVLAAIAAGINYVKSFYRH